MSTTPDIDQLTDKILQLGLKPKSTKSELKKQLKRASHDTKFNKISYGVPITYYLVCDFEATCEQDSGFYYANEIIEFPVILYRNNNAIDRFHQYVRPILNPNLSNFCTALTGITQRVVDEAQPFDVVYRKFRDWLSTHTPAPFSDCIFVTDGVWDLRDFIEKEFTYYSFIRPEYMFQAIDIRKAYSEFYGREPVNLAGMLEGLDLQFVGREHSGIDDSINIGIIFKRMVDEGYVVKANLNLRKKKCARKDWSKLRKLLSQSAVSE